MKEEKNELFLIIEELNSKPSQENLEKAWEYRNDYVSNNKLDWNRASEGDDKGVLIFKGSFRELQKYIQEDPISDEIRRNITPIQKATSFGDTLNTDIGIAELGSNDNKSLMGCDTNY